MNVNWNNLAEYWDALRAHDWNYDFSDDPGVWRAGAAEGEWLLGVANLSPEHKALYLAFKNAPSWRDYPVRPK